MSAGGRPRPELPRFDRAPRLRRIASLIDAQAERSSSPARARAIACRMRLRASELEAGGRVSDEQEAARLMAEMASEADLEAEFSTARLARHKRLAGSGP